MRCEWKTGDLVRLKSGGPAYAIALSCQRLEQIIRYELPPSIRTYGVIREWIERRYIGVLPKGNSNDL